MIKRLWKGDVSLGVTFWVFGVLILAIIDALYFNLYRIIPYAYNLMGKHTLSLLYGIIALHFIYALFIFIAIYRSAKKYKGPRFLAITSIVLVIIATALLLVFPAALIVNSYLTPANEAFIQEMNKELASLNKELPKKIDDDTELYKANFDSKNNTAVYYFHLTIDDAAADKLENNRDQIKDHITEAKKKSLCETQEIKDALSKHDVTLIYNYDFKGKELFNIRLTKSGCGL